MQKIKCKNVPELVDKTTAALLKVNKDTKPGSKDLTQVGDYLDGMKTLLYGVGVSEASLTEITGTIAGRAYTTELLTVLAQKIEFVEFEAKKDAVQIFTKLLRREVGQEPMARHPTVEHICKDPKVLGLLIHGYDEEHTQVW